eukprot:TRINITY_DN3139_c0_g2_i1.p1 TRINITY_DN3139_c0_g2~~TRINITY_DN3139_c0_g2_i1.p1  ORF type:complete len:795 (-),score=80.30 TRINITY_DN3139_c0_g2_i1:274-2658(-)
MQFGTMAHYLWLVLALFPGMSVSKYLTHVDLQHEEIDDHPSCRCAKVNNLERYVVEVDGALCLVKDNANPSNVTALHPANCYPPNYGVGKCRMWDAGHGACASANPEPWCFHVWCYVDARNCSVGDVSTSVFFSFADIKTPSYSYMACPGAPILDNPFYVVYVPTPQIVAAAVTCIVILGGAIFLYCKLVQMVHGFLKWHIALTWIVLFAIECARISIEIMELRTRIPQFPSLEVTSKLGFQLSTVALCKLLHDLCVVMDGYLRAAKLVHHRENEHRKEINILKSVLLYKEMHIDSWWDLVISHVWKPLFCFTDVVLATHVVFAFLDFPVLSGVVDSSLATTYFLIFLGSGMVFKEDLLAAVVLTREQRFEVGDLISLHAICNNNQQSSERIFNAVCTGFVEHLGIFFVTIRCLDMRQQYVPTRHFVHMSVKNWNKREYRCHTWFLTLALRTPVAKVRGFQKAAQAIIKSHPSFKSDGYLKVAITKLKDGGFALEVVCFTKPKTDYYGFKTDISCSLTQLAARLGTTFMWENLTHEVIAKAVDSLAYPEDDDEAGAVIDTSDLLFHGKSEKGCLVSKLAKPVLIKLDPRDKTVITSCSVSIDVLFSVALSDSSVLTDKELHWKLEESPFLKGSLTVLVEEANLQISTKKGYSILGHEHDDFFVKVNILKRTPESTPAVCVLETKCEPSSGNVEDASSAMASIHHEDDVVIASARTHNEPPLESTVLWSDPLTLGTVSCPHPSNRDGSQVFLQVVLYREGGHGHHAHVAGVAEKPLVEFLQAAWKDSGVKVNLEL